jgi:chromosome segregation ATPase
MNIEDKIKSLNADKANIETELHSLNEEQKNLNSKVVKNDSMIKEYEAKIKALQDENNTNKKSIDKLAPKFKSLKEKLDKIKVEIDKKEKDKLAKENERLKKDLEKSQKEAEKAKIEAAENKAVIKKIAIASTEKMIENSCVYLFCLGKTKDLTDFMIPADKISDTTFVYKFGLTNDINRREKEHKNKYEKYTNVSLSLTHTKKCSILVNNENENKLFEMFRSNSYCFITSLKNSSSKEKFNELVVISNKDLNKVKKFYNEL